MKSLNGFKLTGHILMVQPYGKLQHQRPSGPQPRSSSSQLYSTQRISPEPNIAIMKDNFNGPIDFVDQYYQKQSHSQQGSWSQQNSSEEFRGAYCFKQEREYSPQRIPRTHRSQISPSEQRLSPPGRRISPSSRRVSPTGRKMTPPGRRILPTNRRMTPTGQRNSPTGQRLSSTDRKMSPTGRRIYSSEQRTSPLPRRISPLGRRMSPTGQKFSSYVADKRFPSRQSPIRRAFPGNRYSPGRRESPVRRYSPTFRPLDEPVENYVPSDSRRNFKQVRPAYEPAPLVTKQDGGYRPHTHESVPYPQSEVRQPKQYNSPWQQERDKVAFAEAMKKREDERRQILKMETFDIPKATDKIFLVQKMEPNRTHFSSRNSRSPTRRERSPIRDHSKRRSPSPRSSRRSWVLEKRQSPDNCEAPPPPIWPGQNMREESSPYSKPRSNYTHGPNMHEKSIAVPVWESNPFKDNNVSSQYESRRPESANRRFNYLCRGRSVSPNPNDFVFDNNGFELLRQETLPNKKDFEAFTDAGSQIPYERNNGKGNIIQRHLENSKAEYYGSDNFNKFDHFQKRKIDLENNITKQHRQIEDDDRMRRDYLDRKGHLVREEEKIHRDNIPDSQFRYFDPKRPQYVQENRYSEPDRHPQDVEGRYLGPEHGHNEDDLRHDNVYSTTNPLKHDRCRENPWKKVDTKPQPILNSALKIKREKAADKLAENIIKRQNIELSGDVSERVQNDLSFALFRIINDMFGEDDISFIEIIIKFNSKFNAIDEDSIYQRVLSNLTRNLKRSDKDDSKIAPKRQSPIPKYNQGSIGL